MKKIYEFSKKYTKEYEKDNTSTLCAMWEAALKALIMDEFIQKLNPELQSKIITETMNIKEKEITHNEQMALDDF